MRFRSSSLRHGKDFFRLIDCWANFGGILVGESLDLTDRLRHSKHARSGGKKAHHDGNGSESLLVGCGGIGGIAAAQLSRAGCDVTVVTGNPEIERVISEQGIRVRDIDGKEWRAAVQAVRSARELSGRYDVCLVATKLTTLGDVLGEVTPVLHENAPILCPQNGLPETHAAKVVGDDRVVGCVVGFGATLIEPGFRRALPSGASKLGG